MAQPPPRSGHRHPLARPRSTGSLAALGGPARAEGATGVAKDAAAGSQGERLQVTIGMILDDPSGIVPM